MMQDKRIRWSWDYLQAMSAESAGLYLLTEREVQFLLTPLSSAQWRTRWTDTIPAEDERHEFIATLQERLLTPMDFCALMIDCIQNNEDVQQAIRDANSGSGVPNGNSGVNPFGVGLGDENILNGLSCDLDSIYGACVAIIDYVEYSARDFIEIVLADANAWGRVIRAIDFIPFIGDLPIVDDLNDLVNWFATNGAAAFDAGYTVALRQDLICDLFNMACANCELTPYDLYSTYANNAGIPLNPEDVFRALVTNMLGLTGNTAFAMGTCAMVAGALASGGSVLGIVGLQGLTTIAASGDPDGDWILYCDPCNPPTIIQRLQGFGNAEMSSAAYGGADAATYRPTEDDYYAGYTGGDGGEVALWDVRYNFAVPTLITAISWTITYRRGFAGGGGNGADLIIDGVSVETIAISYSATEQTHTFTWTGSQTVTQIRTTGGVYVDPHYSVGGKVERLEITLG